MDLDLTQVMGLTRKQKYVSKENLKKLISCSKDENRDY